MRAKNLDDVVVYRYTDDEYRDDMVPLGDLLRDWIRSHAWDRIHMLAERLQRVPGRFYVELRLLSFLRHGRVRRRLIIRLGLLV